MSKNNSKARKQWRKDKRIALQQQHKTMDPAERLLLAIFGKRVVPNKPGTDEENDDDQ